MPAPLDAKDRKLVIGAAIVMVVLLGVTYVSQPMGGPRSIGFPSSYSAKTDGAKAAYLLLQRLGYQVDRWERPPDDLATEPGQPGGEILILAEPFPFYGDSDRAAIRRFVSNGGNVLAIGSATDALVPEVSANPDLEAEPDLDSKHYQALVPSPITAGASPISMRSPDRWVARGGSSALALYGTEDHPVVTTVRVGKGQVIWWASDWPLTNAGVREDRNVALLLNSLGPPGERRVLWDEYFHGMRESFFSYLSTTPLPWAGVQVAFAFLLIVFTFSRRSGPTRAPVMESRLSPLEFIETLGDLYQSARATPVAVGVAYQRYRTLLLRKLGLSTRANLHELSRAAAPRLGMPEASLFDTCARSEKAMRSLDLDENEAVGLVQQLHEYSLRLDPPRHAPQEPTWK